MNFPDLTFWTHLLATVGAEVCLLAALGFVAQRLFRPAFWQRAAWQVVVICLLLLPASEWTGAGRGAAGFLFGQKRGMETASAAGVQVAAFKTAGRVMAAKLDRPSATPSANVWWPGWIWLAGAILVLGRIVAAQVLLLTLRLRREKIAAGPLRDRVARVAKSIGLRRNVVLLRMPQAISPMAFGLLRPCVGLPPGFETKWSAAAQEAVLAHELAHLAAMDPLWFLLADLATALLWWHPLAWWARRSLRDAAEWAADEATTLLPDGPGALADCLVGLGKEMTASRAWGWIGINGGFRSELGKRVERLMRMSATAKGPLNGWLQAAARMAATCVVVPVIVLFFGAFQSARAQKEDSWSGQLRQSWNISPAGLLLVAVTENDQPAQADKLQNAKLLYEMGKYDDAETIFNQLIKDDPSNRAARYYLDLIKEARYMEGARQSRLRPAPWRDTNALYTKTFHVNPRVFLQNLEQNLQQNLDHSGSKTNSTLVIHRMVRDYLAAAGVDLTPPKMIFFNDRLGELLVRATLSDLAIIQQAVEMLNPAPPQIMIEAEFVELSQEQSLDLGTMTGVLTPSQFRTATNAIGQLKGVNVISTAKASSESGRKIHIGSVNGKDVVEVEVLPIVSVDGLSIVMTATPKMKLGEQTWQAIASDTLLDGQTLVVSGEIPNQPPGAKKTALVFITTRIIDAAGNTVHTDDEIAHPPGIPAP